MRQLEDQENGRSQEAAQTAGHRRIPQRHLARQLAGEGCPDRYPADHHHAIKTDLTDRTVQYVHKDERGSRQEGVDASGAECPGE